MPWRYIDPFYEKLSRHTTIYGKYWLIFITVFRLTVIPFADNCWSDEQKEFKCNTQEPGCNNVCFNQFAPINSVRLWSMQILAITAPLALYIVFVFHLAEERRQKEKSDTEKADEAAKLGSANQHIRKRNLPVQNGTIKIGCPAHEKLNKQIIIPDYLGAVRETDNREKLIWRLYIANVLLRTILDVIFIWMQWQIYPYKAIIPEVFECTRKPCPHTVECWPSRVKEKTIFFHYMYIVACITCLINVAELCYIGPRRILNAFTCCVSTKDLKPGFDEKSNKSVKSAESERSSGEKRKSEGVKKNSMHCSLPGQSPSPVLKMPPREFYHYDDRYYERRPTLYQENPNRQLKTNEEPLNVRHLAVDQVESLRRGSFMETSADRENLYRLRNQNNNSGPNKRQEENNSDGDYYVRNPNTVLAATRDHDILQPLHPRIYYNCDSNQKK